MKLALLLLVVTIGVISAQYGGGAPAPSYPAPVGGPAIPWRPPFPHGHYPRSWSRSDSRSRSRSRSQCHKCKKLGLYRGPGVYTEPKIDYDLVDGCWQAVASCPFNGRAYVLVGLASKTVNNGNAWIIGGAVNLERVITCTDDKDWEATDLVTQSKVQFKYVTCALLTDLTATVTEIIQPPVTTTIASTTASTASSSATSATVSESTASSVSEVFKKAAVTVPMEKVVASSATPNTRGSSTQNPETKPVPSDKDNSPPSKKKEKKPTLVAKVASTTQPTTTTEGEKKKYKPTANSEEENLAKLYGFL